MFRTAGNGSKIPQGKVATDWRSLSKDAQNNLKNAKSFGDLPGAHLQHPLSVFQNPYRSAGSTPLALHKVAIARGQLNTGVSRTVIGPTGPNAHSGISKTVIRPRNTLPPSVNTVKTLQAQATKRASKQPGGLIVRGVKVNQKSALGKPGFFPKPSGV